MFHWSCVNHSHKLVCINFFHYGSLAVIYVRDKPVYFWVYLKAFLLILSTCKILYIITWKLTFYSHWAMILPISWIRELDIYAIGLCLSFNTAKIYITAVHNIEGVHYFIVVNISIYSGPHQSWFLSSYNCAEWPFPWCPQMTVRKLSYQLGARKYMRPLKAQRKAPNLWGLPVSCWQNLGTTWHQVWHRKVLPCIKERWKLYSLLLRKLWVTWCKVLLAIQSFGD